MKFNKKILLITFGVGTALVLAGCGAKSQNHKTSSATSPSTSKVTSHKPNINSSAHKEKAHISKSSIKSHSVNHNASNNSSNNSVNTSSNDSNKSTVTSNASSNSANSNNTLPNSEVAGLPSVDLGNGVTGYEDRGAGQEYITFAIHGKKYVVHGNDVQPGADALPKAQNVVHSVLG